ncbi:amidohydrolase [Terracidiphilus gabretensis]|uniref:amidohydrolase n=1 Tax=Terracidiphilus gabretensis TaxID=1577687 RepID=UPI000AE2248B|nr:amidohydrolase [Terracidiphilus gabretensis]
MRSCLLILGGMFFAAMPAMAQVPADLPSSVQGQLPSLIETYKHLHQNPELSHHEEKTSAYLGGELRKLGYTVTEHVGKYEDGTQAFGIVAVLENGAGPRLLIRSDMDALPVEEKTGLEYASTVKTTNAQGQNVSVMHACGHDIHITVLLGTAREMAARKSKWHGTLMLVGQPSEETIDGAKAMLTDHVYERFGKPDLVLAEHVTNNFAAGTIAVKSGTLMAGATSVNVTIRGVGSHGSAPQTGKDPIVLAAEFILAAQTIVSRQIDPQTPAVVTVGTIHGGTKNNIIPEEVTMGLSLRSFSDEIRAKMVSELDREAKGLAEGYGIPADRMPTVKVFENTPATINDPGLNAKIRASGEAALGKENVRDALPLMGSEDVGQFSLEGKIPAVMFWVGGADAQKLEESHRTGVSLPNNHSPLFAPVYEPTIRTGVTAVTAMALDILK